MSVRQDNDFCAEVRARGIAAIYRDLRFWENPVTYWVGGEEKQMFGNAPFDSRVGGPVIYLDARHLSRQHVVHEAVHTVPHRGSRLNDPPVYGDHDRTPLGTIDQTAAYCRRRR